MEVDLHSEFEVDLADLPDRNWRWLRVRIQGLLTDPSTRTYRATVKHPAPAGGEGTRPQKGWT